MAFVYHVELTNLCDLDCSYCSLTYSVRRKGHMSEATFRKVVAHMQKSSPLNFMMLHHFGEPLLHPELERFVEIASRAHLNPGFSTNGQTLTRARFEELVRHGLAFLCIVFHTTKGREAYEELRGVAREHGIALWGRQLIPTEKPYDPGAVLDYGIERQLLHTFAGAVGPADVKPPGSRPPCDFLDGNFVCILHDGRVVPCSMDEHGDDVLGTVDELDTIVQRSSYERCRSCQGFTFYNGHRDLVKRLVESQRFKVDVSAWR
jgi:MoaA/NifB/PqqE/SkfB family radical SAM enzyme